MDKTTEVASSYSGSLREELVIVLQISEAIGLNAAETVWAQASLSGNKLDREPIKTGHTTSFECSLVWETDRRSIKRMKIENLPVKVDVYRIKNYKGNINEATKEHIGYILQPVRGIPTLSVEKALKAKCRWTKLIGLSKEWRPHKPELLMNIMVTEKHFLDVDKSKIQEIQSIDTKDSMVFEENPNPTMMTSQKGIFIRLLQKEGVLQVGNIDTECDIFNVRLLIQNIKFLDNIVTDNPDNISNREFFINYILLGNSHSRRLDRKFNRIHQISEKISINFRSSLKSLHDYFEHIFYVPIEIYLDSQLVGSSELRLDQIIDITSLDEYIEKFPKGIEYDGTAGLKTATQLDTPNRPVLEYKVLILYQSTKKLHQSEIMDSTKDEQIVIDEKAGGDFEKVDCESENSSKIQVTSVGVGKKRSDEANLPSNVQSDRIDIESILNVQESGKMSEIPRLFVYNLHLKSMKFNKKPHKGIWQISFFHEMADTPRTFINRDITESDIEDSTLKFKDLELKLFFTSHSDHIMDLVKSSQACTLCVRGPHNTHAKAYLDCRNMMIGSKERTCGSILLTNQNETVTALAEIFVYLDDAGLNFNAKRMETSRSEFDDNKDVTRTLEVQKDLLFDESIAHKMIDELEEWKDVQQKKFLVDLKCTEGNYLIKLKDEFDLMKASYEAKYKDKNSELKALTRSLEDAHQSLQLKNVQNQRNEEHVNSMKMEMEQIYADKLMAMKERTKQLEQELMHELNVRNVKIEELECSNKMLYEKVSFLTHENCDLKSNVDCLNAKYDALQANVVPKEEVEQLIHEMRLLQEKFDAAHQSKNFYKQQWAKAFRECHKIRREDIYDRKNNLFTDKCDRLCDMLSDESSRLNFEREELEEIKHCLRLDDEL